MQCSGGHSRGSCKNCLGELNLTYALIYLDDIIVFSSTEEDHIHCLRVVFGRFLGTWAEAENPLSVISYRMK